MYRNKSYNYGIMKIIQRNELLNLTQEVRKVHNREGDVLGLPWKRCFMVNRTGMRRALLME